MNLSRRALFGGLAALAAPAIIRTPGLLMPIKTLLTGITLYEYATCEIGYVIQRDVARRWFINQEGLLQVENISREMMYAA